MLLEIDSIRKREEQMVSQLNEKIEAEIIMMKYEQYETL